MVKIEPHVRRASWPPLLHRVVKTVRARDLFEPGQHVLVAVSGGPDSVALVTLLHGLVARWRLRLTAVHFNYGLRGNESDGDQAFVVSLCDELEIPLHCIPLDVRTRPRRVSLQAQARDLRYCAMNRLAEDVGADRIAVGHTADDQAETILLWMLRGAGLTGLAGMPAQRDGMVIRPLYEIRRREVLTFLNGAGRSYRQDSSNAKPLYTRNRIRQELVPVLTRIAPAAIDALCRMGDLCREDDRYMDAQATHLGEALIRPDGDGRYSVDRRQFLAQPPALQRRLLRGVFRLVYPTRRAPGMATVEDVRRFLSSQKEEAQHCAAGVWVRMTPYAVCVEPVDATAVQSWLPEAIEVESAQVPSPIEWAGTGPRIRVQKRPPHEAGQIAASRVWSMVVDADLISYPVCVRAWRAGDRFFPAGMKGRSKKLQDLFTDLKIPLAQRGRLPILESPEGILGVLGFRQDERFRVSAATRRCLVISLEVGTVTEGVH